MAKLRKENADKQSNVLRYRCTENEAEKIKNRAKDAGLSLSEYQRQMCLSGKVVIKQSKHDPALIQHLLAIGNNLNQLTRLAHMRGFSEDDIARLNQPLEQLTNVLDGLT